MAINKRTGKKGVRYTVTLFRNTPEATSKTFDRKADALDWQAEMQRAKKRGEMIPDLDRRTVAMAIDSYLLNAEHLPIGRKADCMDWRALIGDWKLSSITRPKMFEIRDRLMQEPTKRTKKPISKRTWDKKLTALSCALGHSRARGWMIGNPLSDPRSATREEKLRFQDDGNKKDALKPAEIKALLNACRESREPALYAFALFGIETGCRAGEIQRVATDDIHRNAGGYEVTIQESKNGLKRRVPISHELRGEIKKLTRHFSGGVFCTRKGTYPFKYDDVLEDAVAEAKIRRITFHYLRHTAITWMCMSGLNQQEVIKLAGWKSHAMIKVYSHLFDDHAVAEGRKMHAKFLG